jgi:hypothetical protein
MSAAALKARMGEKIQALSGPTERDTTMSNTTLTIAGASHYVALKSDAMGIISENLKNQQLSPALFDVVKSPSGGITSFSVPGLSGEVMEKELTGIILDYTTPRAYWDTPDPVEGTPPLCWSNDSIISHEGKSCAQCHNNDFGSKNGGESNAKACKESVALYLLRPDSIMPIIVRVPVSSKLLFMKYATRLVSSMTPINGVVTRITLEKATSRDGKPYALYNFEAVSALSAEEAAAAKAFGSRFMEILNAAETVPVSVEGPLEEAV